MEQQSGKGVAVVTGGTGALGRHVVATLLERGLRVHVPWIVEAEAAQLTDLLGDPHPDLVLAEADVADPEGADAFFREVWRSERRLDALCALVGGFLAAPLDQTAPAGWDRMQRLNATTVFLCCRAAAPLLRETGGGAIVTVASLPAVEGGAAGMAAYAASKAAVVNLTRSLAKELRDDRVRVNAIAPEILDTPENRAAMPGADTSRWLAPAAVARVVAFLVGHEGTPVTGSVLKLMGS